MMKEMWNQRYAADEYVYGKIPNQFFQEKLEGLNPGHILLPAEGEGRNAVYAARMGWTVTAIDFSEVGQRKAMQLAEENEVQIEYLLADLESFDFGELIYDMAVLIYMHLPPETRTKIHQNITKSLKPGGYLVLEAFSKNQLRNASGGPKSLDMLYSIEMLQNDFNELKMLQLEELSLHVDAGSGHGGVADLVRMFAKKMVQG